MNSGNNAKSKKSVTKDHILGETVYVKWPDNSHKKNSERKSK